jgi:signal transduction histidine kinase
LLLLTTALVVYLGGVVGYRLLVQESAQRSRLAQIADRLSAAMEALDLLPPQERAAAARTLSSASLRVTWSPTSLVEDASAGAAELQHLRETLHEVNPELSGRELHLRWDEHVLGSGHDFVLGEAQLTDGSYVVFSAAILQRAVSSLSGALFVASLVFASILAMAIYLLHAINTPLRHLAAAAHRYGRGEMTILPERGPREILEVKRAFNAMQNRIQRLIADRTQALAAVSHDLRTPIARLRLRCESLPDKTLRAECGRDLAEMEAMIDSTLTYLRGEDDSEPRRATDVASMLATLVDDTVDAGCNATLSGPRHVVAMIRTLSVKRALANLIDNAVTYGGCARVTVEQAGDEIRITIDDDGPGIAEADMPRVFEPFHRFGSSHDPDTAGVGLGLTIARRAIEREGGTIRLSNRPEGGLRAEVRLPLGRADDSDAIHRR